MNARAYMYEGLDFTADDFLPSRKNRAWHLIRDMIDGLGKRFAEAEMVRRERAQLRTLDDRMLKDIGLSRYDVQFEINRSFFDVGDVHVMGISPDMPK